MNGNPSHTLISYPSDTNRMTLLASPGGGLNSSAAALNASIKALTDAITSAQAVLATLVPYSGATEDVDLDGHGLTCNHLTAGSVTVNNYTLPAADGSAGDAMTTDGAGNVSFGSVTVDSGSLWQETGSGPTILSPVNSDDRLAVASLGLDDQGAFVTIIDYATNGNGTFVSAAFDNPSYPSGTFRMVVGYGGWAANIYYATDGASAWLWFATAGGGIAVAPSGNLVVGPGVTSSDDGNTLQVLGTATFASGALAIDANGGVKLADYTTIASPVEGQIAWNYTTHALTTYDGSAWT